MNFQRGRKTEDLEINFVPLIDVLLVIIIFLIVSATFSRVSELQVNLPTSETATPLEEKPHMVIVGVFADGHYVIDRKPVADSDVAGLGQAMKEAAGATETPTIVIEADAGATHQAVIRVLDAARRAGFANITFPAQEPAGS